MTEPTRLSRSLATGKVLVTGAGGFIASHLAEALVRVGADVVALVHYNSRNDWGNLEHLDREILRGMRVVPGDIGDQRLLSSVMKGRTHVFHLAALIAIPYSYRTPSTYVSTNVGGTLNVLQAALDCGVEHVVHTSTSEVYGSARYVPIDELHPLQAQSPYAATKIAADKLAESFKASFGLPVVTVRPFNTYGPRQSARAVIPTIIAQALAGPPVRLGNLSPIRDLCFVADTIEGFLLAANTANVVGQVVNLGTGVGVSIGELAERIFAILGVDPSIESDTERVRPDASEVTRLLASAAKAKQLLGWSPRVALDDGLRATIDWIRAHPELYKPEIYNV